jgi:hypothetical protein
MNGKLSVAMSWLVLGTVCLCLEVVSVVSAFARRHSAFLFSRTKTIHRS